MLDRQKSLLKMVCTLTSAESGALFSFNNENIELTASFNFDNSLDLTSEEFSNSIEKVNNERIFSLLVIENKNCLLINLSTSVNHEEYLILIFSEKNDIPTERKIISFIDPIKENFKSEEYADIINNPFSSLKVAVLVSDSSGSLITANNSFYSLFDIKTQNLTDFSWSDYKIYSESSQKINLDKTSILNLKNEDLTQKSNRIRIVDKQNNSKWLNVQSFPAENSATNNDIYFSLIEDITQSMKLESRIRETAENIDSVLYSTDASGNNYNFISGAAERIIGYQRDSIENNKFSILRLIQPEYFGEFKEFVKNISAGYESVVEYKIKDKQGNEKYIRHTGVPISENGVIVRIVGMISDISKEKFILERLEKSEHEFRLLIDTAEDLIFMLDNFGYFKMINRNGALTLGYRPEEMIGKHFLEYISENKKSEIAVAFQKILTSDEVVPFEAAFSLKLRKEKVFEIQARQIKEDTEIGGLLGIGRDVTVRKKDELKLKELNAKLIEANRLVSIERDRAKHQISTLEELNKLKNDFISNVSHELRTPLASIVGFAESLVSDPDLPSDMVTEFNNIILTEGKRLARLINDMLDFSKLESDGRNLQKSEFDIIILLNEIVKSNEEQALTKGLTLSSEIPEAEILITADRERLAKALNNIFLNAIKFTNSGGRITVIVNNFLKEFEIIISDTGIGIPEIDIPHLFEKFRKVNRPGSQLPGAGFGLVTVKQIIDLHKGLIRINSEVDKGTTVLIKLPK